MDSNTSLQVGVLGLGIIGSRVAGCLRAAGHTVFVWNRTPRAEPQFLPSPEEVARRASIIQIFVRDDEALQSVLEQMAPALGEGHLVMNHATVSPEATRAAAAFCQACGADFLDAPFTGSKLAAQNGRLAYYLGGSEAVIARARSVLEASATQILPMGEVGAATVVKIATNLLSAATVKALVEAAAITRSCGVELDCLMEAFKVNANFSNLIAMKLPAIQAGEFEPHFSLQNMLKDAEYARALASRAGLATPVLDATTAAMQAGVNEGKGNLDFSVIGDVLSAPEV